MQRYQQEFIDFILQHQIFQFGDFTLKSGRKSHYFFNAGRFNTGALLARVGEFYAEAIVASNLSFDILFGPAYKGIPLVTATAIALANHHQYDYPYAFNRKEAKDHGEGGVIVGAPLKGRVLIIDDVITAGTAIRQSIEIIRGNGAEIAGVILAFDREEKGEHKLSAIEEIRENYHIPVVPIIKRSDIKESF